MKVLFLQGPIKYKLPKFNFIIFYHILLYSIIFNSIIFMFVCLSNFKLFCSLFFRILF